MEDNGIGFDEKYLVKISSPFNASMEKMNIRGQESA